MTASKLIRAVRVHFLLAISSSFLLLLCACQSQKQQPTLSATTRSSTLQVKVEPDGVRLQSSTAEFFLNSSGYLAASLRHDGNLLTLDEANGNSGQQVVVN